MNGRIIEAEGSELIIRNKAGDYAIIPKQKAKWVKEKLAAGCHKCIDALVENLPLMEDYAEDGSLYKNDSKSKTMGK